MRTLYITDLDGTLLRSDRTISPYTTATLNRLINKGMIFSYATGRSYTTASKLTAGITARIPAIVFNGAFVIDSTTNRPLLANYFTAEEKSCLRQTLIDGGVEPIVYAHIDGAERYSFRHNRLSEGARMFNASRAGDPRSRAVETEDELFAGEMFSIMCIGEEDVLGPVHERLKDGFHSVHHIETYTKWPCIEITSKAASKSNAVLKMKEMLGCDRIVAFGDAMNDLDLFEIADECYAVANAAEELKRHATGVVASNDEDGVARWLAENY